MRLFVAFAIVLVCVVAIGLQVVIHTNISWVREAKVTGKERACSSSGYGTDSRLECKYMVFTDKGVFKNTDTMWHGFKFNSSDVQGKLQDGCTYDFYVYGFRIPWASTYKNIVRIKNQKCPEDSKGK